MMSSGAAQHHCHRNTMPHGVAVATPARRNGTSPPTLSLRGKYKEVVMGFGRGLLLWLLGIPLPIIILLALFWHQ
jgi:hypothetical protein